MTERKRDDFYWAVMKVLRDNGHSRDRARAIYLELQDAIGELLAAGELHVKGLITVTIKSTLEQTYNGWTGDPMNKKKMVHRASAKLRRRLRAALEKP